MSGQTLSSRDPPSTEPPASSTKTAPQAIPSHPAPTDAAATSSGVEADGQNPDAVTARQIDSDRGMRNTSCWKPSFGRRQSWDQEEQKHTLQMTGLQNVKACPGFSENK